MLTDPAHAHIGAIFSVVSISHVEHMAALTKTGNNRGAVRKLKAPLFQGILNVVSDGAREEMGRVDAAANVARVAHTNMPWQRTVDFLINPAVRVY